MRTNFSIARKAKIRSNIKEHEQRCAKQMLLEKTEVKTNADRIRAMSDEELADYLSKTFCHGYGKPQLVEWLKQVAKGE